jgi:hypothetical protein
MAVTLLANVVVPSIFAEYVIEETTNRSALFKSGIFDKNATFNSLVAGGGQTFNLPFWQNLSGRSTAMQSGTTLTAANITASTEIAVRLIRGKLWGAEDIAAELAGDDPMRAIAQKVADFWAEDIQLTTIACLDGIFADNLANDSGDLINDISGEDGNNATDAQLIGSDAVIDSIFLLGDAFNKVTTIAMHSVPYARLQKLNLIDFEPTNTQNVGFGTYLGKTVIVDDNLGKTAGSTSGFKYDTYLFMNGSIAWGESPAKNAVEMDRVIADSQDLLANRRQFTVHPRGYSFISGSVAGATPTDTELALAANWNRVYELKNTGIVKLVTNG